MNRGAVKIMTVALAFVSILSITRQRALLGQEPPGPLPAIHTGLPHAAEVAMNGIDPERLRAHTRFLSLDLMEGRGPGQRGGDLAVEYMAAQLALTGLKPAGEKGTYYQSVPMVFMKALPQSQFQFVPNQGEALRLRFLDDIIVQNESQTETSDVDAPVVFVGYGIDAPEFHWDDYKGVDVRGKVVVMFAGEPRQTLSPTKGLNWYYKWSYKWDEAATKGAVACIIINREDMSTADWKWIQNTHGAGRVYLKYGETPKVKAAAWIQWEMARKLLAYGNKDLDRLLEQANTPEFRPVALPVNFKAHVVSQVHRFTTYNLIGIIPGSDPKLREQAVVYTAHWDHLGIVPDWPGDNIYNGAEDNATGSASLIELARAFVSSSVRPARSIFLVSTAAEEHGMIGAEYFTQHPPISDTKIVVDLNYDGQAPWGDAEEVRAGGAERTNYLEAAQQLAGQFAMTLPSPKNEGAGCCRSDTFWFNSVGIPAFSMGPGPRFAGHPLEWSIEKAKDFRLNHYHQPSDEYHDDWDFRGPARVARYGFALGWKAASDPVSVQWKQGAEYSAAREKHMFCAPEHLCP